MKNLKLLAFFLLLAGTVIAREYHVSVKGIDTNDGSALKPFRTINFAAQIAEAGDVITVHAGTYRERIDPARGGKTILNGLSTGQHLAKKWKSKVRKLSPVGKRRRTESGK